MYGIAIIRRGDNRPRYSATTVETVNRRLNGPKVRVKRTGIAGLFVPGKGRKVSDFYKVLPVLPSALVNNAAALVADGPKGQDCKWEDSWIMQCGWIVPDADLGKYRETGLLSVEDANSCRNSLRLWITQNLGEVVDVNDLSIVHFWHD